MSRTLLSSSLPLSSPWSLSPPCLVSSLSSLPSCAWRLIFSRITFAPEPPRSHFSASDSAAHHVTADGWPSHERVQGPWPCTRYDHRGAPDFRSNATIDLRNDPGCSHESSKPP